MKLDLDALLEGLEVKLWLLVIAEMEVLLAEELLAALDELSVLAASSRHAAGTVPEQRAKCLEATVARIEAELEAIERSLANGTAKPTKSNKSTDETSPNGAAIIGRRNRGRPRKSDTAVPGSTASGMNDSEHKDPSP